MKRLISVIGIVVIINLLLIFTPTNNMFQILFYNVGQIGTSVVEEVESFFEIFSNKTQLIEENQKLKEENENLKSENKKKKLENETLESKNTSLANSLEVKKSTNYSTLMADVLFEQVNTSLNILTINKGLDDGVKENQLVSFDGKLIGYVLEVKNTKSEVMLLNNKNIKFNIPININTNDGKKKAIIEEYNPSGYLVLSTIDQENSIKKGDGVYTNGYGTNQRENVYLGTISSILNKGEQGEKYGVSFSLKNMEYVEVVTYEN